MNEQSLRDQCDYTKISKTYFIIISKDKGKRVGLKSTHDWGLSTIFIMLSCTQLTLFDHWHHIWSSEY